MSLPVTTVDLSRMGLSRMGHPRMAIHGHAVDTHAACVWVVTGIILKSVPAMQLQAANITE